MFKFRLFVVGVLLALAVIAVFLVQEATAVAPTRESNRLSPAYRSFILEKLNDADNVNRQGMISPLPYLTAEGQGEGSSGDQIRRRR